MKTPREAIDFIGPARMREKLRVGQPSIAKARRDGRFPACWYDAMENMAGRPLPREWFSFKGKDDAQS